MKNIHYLFYITSKYNIKNILSFRMLNQPFCSGKSNSVLILKFQVKDYRRVLLHAEMNHYTILFYYDVTLFNGLSILYHMTLYHSIK